MRPFFLLSFLAACSPPVAEEAEPVDHTTVWTPTREGALEILTPTYEVPPYADQTTCWFTTYDGPDVAIPFASFHQATGFGHHVVLMGSEARVDLWPDGTVADCTSTDADIMVDSRPFLFPKDLDAGQAQEMNLPEGMAVKLKAGQRFVVQSHHINLTEDPILVNDAVFLQTAPLETIDTFAAPWVNTETEFTIPPGETMAITVDCTWEDDLNLLSILGHLHEWGKSYAVDHHKLDGSVERIYEINEWDVVFRDAPPITTWDEGEFQVKAGERFVTTCEWTNTTDEPLEFPHEMCATVGFGYPLTVPSICEPS